MTFYISAEEPEKEADEGDDVDVEASEHEYHFRYNRRLGCFSHSVCSLTFSQDGAWLVSGTATGDVKVWDTNCWAEASKLRGCKREESRALVVSPSQRWVVSAYSSALCIFGCRHPWKHEHTLPAPLDPATKECHEWACVAFAPMVEVDHPSGHTGTDNHLAAFSTGQMCVFDYSGGWNAEMPRRTRSLMQSGRPTSLAYTDSGWWMACGFQDGQLQIWNAFSLTLEKTLSGHIDAVNCLASSPGRAEYESRIISCSVDQTLRVWHSSGWILEQHLHDNFCDRAGVRTVSFSSTGRWLVSVSSELSVWRVCITQRGRLLLRLHQRLMAVCGVEGLRSAAFCCRDDAIAVGSRDGVLGLWTKFSGMPDRDPAEPIVGEQTTHPPRGDAQGSAPWQGGGGSGGASLPRPMQRLTPQGIKPLSSTFGVTRQQGQPNGNWWRGTQRRSFSITSLGSPTRTSNPSSASTGRIVLAGSSGDVPSSPKPARSTSDRLPRVEKHDTVRWSRNFDVSDILTGMDTSTSSREVKRSQSACGAKHDAVPDRMVTVPERMFVADHSSPARKTASTRLVKRIALDPFLIVDSQENST